MLNRWSVDNLTESITSIGTESDRIRPRSPVEVVSKIGILRAAAYQSPPFATARLCRFPFQASERAGDISSPSTRRSSTEAI